MRTKMKTSSLVIALTMTATPALADSIMYGSAPAATSAFADPKDQETYDALLKSDAEMHAMGRCLVNQVKIHGWAGHGTRAAINAFYARYGDTCYDKVKPTLFDMPGNPDMGRIMWTTSAEYFDCHLDDYDRGFPASYWNDDSPMTCFDPTARKLIIEWQLAADWLAGHGRGGKYEGR